MQARLSFSVLLFSALLVLASPAFSVGGSAPSGEGVSPGCEAVIDDGGGRRGQCSSAGGMPGGVFRLSNINQADIALLADVARARYDVDGSGLKVGVISTSYNYLGGEDYDVERGVLPDNVYVLYDDGDDDDEGRAMAQLVHSVAPGAELYVSSWKAYQDPLKTSLQDALADQETFAQRIRELVDLGCDVIVDDIYNPSEPWFQDGSVSLAVDEAVQNGVAYFSAASNNSNVSYQSEIFPIEAPSHLIDYWNDPTSGTPAELAQALSNSDLSFHNFAQGDGVEVLQRLDIPNFSDHSSFWVQWDQPWEPITVMLRSGFLMKTKGPSERP